MPLERRRTPSRGNGGELFTTAQADTMQRTVEGIIVAVLITAGCVIAGCESPSPDASMPDDAVQADTTQVPTADTATAAPLEGDAAENGTSQEDGMSREDDEAAAAGPGVSLQTILDQAFARDPQTGELRLLDRLNEPRSVSVETHENIHDPGQTDTLRTRRYDGMELTVYHVSGGKEILKNVTVTGSGYETEQGLTVGMTRTEVESLRGRPDQRQNGTYVYNLGGPIPTMLHIAFRGDEVSRMEWQYPID